MTRPIKGHGAPCEAAQGCPRQAFANIAIKGVHAHRRDPVDTCKLHSTIVLGEFLSISNDIHVRNPERLTP